MSFEPNLVHRTIRVAPAASVRRFEDTPVKVKQIHFSDEVEKIRFQCLPAEIGPIYDAVDFKDLVQRCYLAKEHMEKVGLFKEIGVVIDTDKAVGAAPDSYEVSFHCTAPRTHGDLFVGVAQDGETQLNATYTLPNLSRRADVLFGSGTVGHRRTSSFDLGYRFPLLGWQRYTGWVQSIATLSKDLPWSKAHLRDSGFVTELYKQWSRGLEQRLRWINSWRYLESLSANTAFPVLEHCGHSFKSSLAHSVRLGSLDSDVLPTRGLQLRLGNEFAGLLGDIKFLKTELEFRSSAPLFAGLILSANLLLSHVHAMRGPSLHLVDRVFLGGPNSVRGFQREKLGPMDADCALGGSSSWALGLHVMRPLLARLVLGHVFCTAGNIHKVHQGKPIWDIAEELCREPRLSVGAGLAINLLGGARVEFNYVVPLRFRASDSIQPGFQFGVGINFL